MVCLNSDIRASGRIRVEFPTKDQDSIGIQMVQPSFSRSDSAISGERKSSSSSHVRNTRPVSRQVKNTDKDKPPNYPTIPAFFRPVTIPRRHCLQSTREQRFEQRIGLNGRSPPSTLQTYACSFLKVFAKPTRAQEPRPSRRTRWPLSFRHLLVCSRRHVAATA